MHIISYKKIRDFILKHPVSKKSLNPWFRIVSNTDFGSFTDIKNLFPSADMVKNFVVFDVGGNNYRVIAFVDYEYRKLFIRHVLTHSEYGRQKWKKDNWFNMSH